MQRFIIPFKINDQKQKCLQIKSKSSLLKKRAVKTWSREQDQKLISLYNLYPKKWNIIAEKMYNRNQNQCLHRFRRICQLGHNKKIWSPQEDQTVLKMIEKVGHNWKQIAQVLGTKNGKQIRERFINKLDPNIRRQQWTQSQDLKIIELYSRLGSKWCQISKSLQGRPQNRIKNRFYSYIQKNYEFKIKQLCLIDQQKYQNKQNNIQTAGIKLIQNFKKIQKNSKQTKIFHQNSFINPQKYLSNIFNCKIDEEKQEQVYNQEEQQELSKCDQIQINQIKSQKKFQSMKQINQECFYKYNQNDCNNQLLYFEEN